jgi:hypothetical protein
MERQNTIYWNAPLNENLKIMASASDRLGFEDVIKAESEALEERRARMAKKFEEYPEPFAQTKFGIALSGGGIRSAIINLGFLRTLNMVDVLRRADYLSTVSGGGYTGAYIQATLKSKGDYNKLFAEEDITHMRNNGEYLIPGQTALVKALNTVLLAVGYSSSLLMSLLSPVIVLGVILLGYRLMDLVVLSHLDLPDPVQWFSGFLWESAVPAILVVLGLHFLANVIGKFKITWSHYFNIMETTIVSVVLVLAIGVGLIQLVQGQMIHLEFLDARNGLQLLLLLVGFFLLGFITDPNALSFHRFYRNKLARAFLAKAEGLGNMPLKDLFRLDDQEKNWLNPYPLINTCLNLQNPSGDDNFKGTKASDYFLLSPLYCGAKLTKYVSTAHFPGYNRMTLPAATTISAAALNPGMGNFSSKVTSVLMTLFNARLGFWVNNPLRVKRRAWVWWPSYFFYELLSKIGSGNRKLNISDGGHIENLGVYELLRRKCRLIIAVDGGADPNYEFADLENLTMRARNELGIEIAFRDTMIPEEVMRVRPSNGYSDMRFSIADLYQIWEEFKLKDDAGQPILDEEGRQVEVLVNYIPDGALAPEVFLEARLREKDYERYLKLAKDQVQAKLNARHQVEGKEKIKVGTLVYVKSSITAPMMKPVMQPPSSREKGKTMLKKATSYVKSFFVPTNSERKDFSYDTYKYKIYHPSFPHESTADQFFDPVQWEAYYQLGQFLAADVLGKDSAGFMKLRDREAPSGPLSILELIEHFDRIGKEEMAERQVRSMPPSTTISQTKAGNTEEGKVGYRI